MLLLSCASCAELWEAGCLLSLLLSMVKDDKLFLGSNVSSV